MDNIIEINSFTELYNWFEKNYKNYSYIWVKAKRGKPNNVDFNYIDAVYCALCFGWIDSTCKNINGITYQKLMPRSKITHWTYLNVVRCKYLLSKGLIKENILERIPLNYNPIIENLDIIDKLKNIKKFMKILINFQIYIKI